MTKKSPDALSNRHTYELGCLIADRVNVGMSVYDATWRSIMALDAKSEMQAKLIARILLIAAEHPDPAPGLVS